MKYVKRQLELIRDLVDEMLEKTEDRSWWQAMAIPNRVKEARAIQKSAEALVEIVKRAIPLQKRR